MLSKYLQELCQLELGAVQALRRRPCRPATRHNTLFCRRFRTRPGLIQINVRRPSRTRLLSCRCRSSPLSCAPTSFHLRVSPSSPAETHGHETNKQTNKLTNKLTNGWSSEREREREVFVSLAVWSRLFLLSAVRPTPDTRPSGRPTAKQKQQRRREQTNQQQQTNSKQQTANSNDDYASYSSNQCLTT